MAYKCKKDIYYMLKTRKRFRYGFVLLIMAVTIVILLNIQTSSTPIDHWMRSADFIGRFTGYNPISNLFIKQSKLDWVHDYFSPVDKIDLQYQTIKVNLQKNGSSEPLIIKYLPAEYQETEAYIEYTNRRGINGFCNFIPIGQGKNRYILQQQFDLAMMTNDGQLQSYKSFYLVDLSEHEDIYDAIEIPIQIDSLIIPGVFINQQGSRMVLIAGDVILDYDFNTGKTNKRQIIPERDDLPFGKKYHDEFDCSVIWDNDLVWQDESRAVIVIQIRDEMTGKKRIDIWQADFSADRLVQYASFDQAICTEDMRAAFVVNRTSLTVINLTELTSREYQISGNYLHGTDAEAYISPDYSRMIYSEYDIYQQDFRIVAINLLTGKTNVLNNKYGATALHERHLKICGFIDNTSIAAVSYKTSRIFKQDPAYMPYDMEKVNKYSIIRLE